MKVRIYVDDPKGTCEGAERFATLLKTATPDVTVMHHAAGAPSECDIAFHWETINTVHSSYAPCQVLVLTNAEQFSSEWIEHLASLQVWAAAIPPMLNKRAKRFQWLKNQTDESAILAAFKELLQKTKPGFVRKIEDPLEWPSISIVTPTRNRPNWLILAKICFLGFDYPRDKLEWVILDDGNMPSFGAIEDATKLDRGRIRYFYSNEVQNIGQKRNRLAELASHDIIMHMDDDDFYGASAVKTLVRELLHFKKQCVFACCIPMYDPGLRKSAFNVPPLHSSLSLRVSEATMCYHKSFWRERKFSEVPLTEGKDFLKGRVHKCQEVSSATFFISLLHAKNSSARRDAMKQVDKESGCVFGINPEILKFIDKIAETTAREKAAGVDYIPLG